MDLDNKNAPEGFRNIYDRTIKDIYLSMDKNGDCIISKNEWMIANLRLLFKDIQFLEKEGPDSIMKYIREFSDEFDKYDADKDYYMQFADFKDKVQSSVYVEED